MAIPIHQMYKAMRNRIGALQTALQLPIASTLLRKTKSCSTNEIGVSGPRRTNHRCCTKHEPTLAVTAALKDVTRSSAIEEICGCEILFVSKRAPLSLKFSI